LQLGIERVLALTTGGAQIVGTPNADRTEQAGDLGLALSLIDCLLTTRAGNAGAGLRSCGQRAQASNQAGAKLLEQADHVVFNVGQAVRLLLHPAAQRAGQRGHALAHGHNQVFCSGGICGRIQVNLLWVDSVG
jgi:hypothetical protein